MPKPTGIRLYHPDVAARGRLCTFAIPGRPLLEPTFCGRCGTEHRVKTYHVEVDSEGFAYVSTTIWQVMREYGETAGFVLANETRGKPPTQHIGGLGLVAVAPAPLRLEERNHRG